MILQFARSCSVEKEIEDQCLYSPTILLDVLCLILQIFFYIWNNLNLNLNLQILKKKTRNGLENGLVKTGPCLQQQQQKLQGSQSFLVCNQHYKEMHKVKAVSLTWRGGGLFRNPLHLILSKNRTTSFFHNVFRR